MQNRYEEAKKLYFVEGKKKESLALLLEEIKYNENNEKAAYFIATIYLKKAMENNSSFIVFFPKAKQKQYFNQGIEWLDKALQLGSEQATLLLGKIHAFDACNDLNEILVKVDEDKIVEFDELNAYTRPDFSDENDKILNKPFHPSVGYASSLLQTISHNKEAARILSSLAFSYLTTFNFPNWYQKQELEYKFLVSEEAIFFSEKDTEFKEQLRIAFEESDFLSPEFILKMETGAKDKIFIAVFFMYRLYAGFDKSLVIEADANKAEMYDQILWQIRFEACEKVIKWLENAINLGCDKLNVSDVDQIEYMKKTFVRFAELRASGIRDDEMKNHIDPLSIPIPKSWQCKVCDPSESESSDEDSCQFTFK